MSVHGGPNTIKSGLVFHLDAGNRRSYPGSGTIWNDLSGNNNNGTLTNGPTYSASNGGVINFDKTDDYVITPSIRLQASITISAWVKHSDTSGQQRYITLENENACIRNVFGSFQFFIKTSGTIKSISANTVLNNTWYYITGTWDGITQKLYQNSILINSSSPGGTFVATNLVCYISFASSEVMAGSISNVSIYNRALSIAEIQQNYNATRGRFGL